MIIDQLSNAHRYAAISQGIAKAFDYLRTTDLHGVAPGKYVIDADNVFAIVNEYMTLDSAGEEMETHKRYIDVQYVVSGEEMVGLALPAGQQVSKGYNEAEDYMQYADAPQFYCKLTAGMFMIFFPTDMHVPSLRVDEVAATVKKVVVKVAVDY